jgi:hypothetical protein
MNYEIETDLQGALSYNEKLLWTGRPKTGIVFRTSDIPLIPFSLLWFGVAIFWEYNVLKTGISFFALFGIPFIIMGLYISIGRFYFDALRRKNTSYGITDNRVIIKSGLFSKSIKSLNIRSMTDLSFTEKRDGSGTISFGPADPRYSMFRGFSYWPGINLQPGFELIEDVKTVYNILLEQQKKV